VLNALDVPAAWRVTQGSGVVVAVIDSGVDPSVSDLTGSVLKGPDFTGVRTPVSNPNWGAHGTWMASLIAGHGHGRGTRNGVLGVAPRAKILSIRVITDRSDPGHRKYQNQPAWRGQRELARGIMYAVGHGAGVISMSLGYDESSLVVRSALQYALDHNVVVVASSGNEGTSHTAQTHSIAPYSFPADYPGVIGVAAVSESGQPAYFSSENLSVSVAAPGVNVPAQGRGSKYWVVSGTSPACALTAGVAALVKAKYPKLTAAQVRSAITQSTAHRPRGGYDDHLGFGTVDAAAALRMAGRLAGQVPSGNTHAGKAAASGNFGNGQAGVSAFPVLPRGRQKLLVFLGIGLGSLLLVIIALALLIGGRRKRKIAKQTRQARLAVPQMRPGPPGAAAAFPGRPIAGGPIAGGPIAGGPIAGGPIAGGAIAGGAIAGGAIAGGSMAGGAVAGGQAPGAVAGGAVVGGGVPDPANVRGTGSELDVRYPTQIYPAHPPGQAVPVKGYLGHPGQGLPVQGYLGQPGQGALGQAGQPSQVGQPPQVAPTQQLGQFGPSAQPAQFGQGQFSPTAEPGQGQPGQGQPGQAGFGAVQPGAVQPGQHGLEAAQPGPEQPGQSGSGPAQPGVGSFAQPTFGSGQYSQPSPPGYGVSGGGYPGPGYSLAGQPGQTPAQPGSTASFPGQAVSPPGHQAQAPSPGATGGSSQDDWVFEEGRGQAAQPGSVAGQVPDLQSPAAARADHRPHAVIPPGRTLLPQPGTAPPEPDVAKWDEDPLTSPRFSRENLRRDDGRWRAFRSDWLTRGHEVTAPTTSDQGRWFQGDQEGEPAAAEVPAPPAQSQVASSAVTESVQPEVGGNVPFQPSEPVMRSVWEPLVRNRPAPAAPATPSAPATQAAPAAPAAGETAGRGSPVGDASIGSASAAWRAGPSPQPDPASASPSWPSAEPSSAGGHAGARSDGLSAADSSPQETLSSGPLPSWEPPGTGPLPRRQPMTHLATQLRRERRSRPERSQSGPSPQAGRQEQAETAEKLPSVWDTWRPAAAARRAAQAEVSDSGDDTT